MSRRPRAALVGLFVLGGLILLVSGVVLLGSGTLLRTRVPFMLYFDGSVNGLRPGAPVKFKGVELGRVSEISLPVDSDTGDLPVPVVVELNSDQIERWQGPENLSLAASLVRQIDRGLRARLESESFVTGVLYVSLVFEPGSPAQLHEPVAGLPEIPTLPGRFETMQEEAQRVLSRLMEADVPGMVERAKESLAALQELASSDELRGAVARLDQTLAQVGSAAAAIEREAGPLAQSLIATSDRMREVTGQVAESMEAARGTLASVESLVGEIEGEVGPVAERVRASAERFEQAQAEMQATLAAVRELVAPEAPLAVGLRATMFELSGAARAARRLAELLEREPSALLRGRAGAGGER